jgi:hypothetical protein
MRLRKQKRIIMANTVIIVNATPNTINFVFSPGSLVDTENTKNVIAPPAIRTTNPM